MRTKYLIAAAGVISVALFGLGDAASARTTYKKSKANVTRSWNQEMRRQKKEREEQRHYQVSQKVSSYKHRPRRRLHHN
jgi:hypothetical protein